jgi:hypothetical protein
MKCKLITTVSDTEHPGFKMLVKSLEKFGWDWGVCGTEYCAFGSKMVNAYNYAKQTDCTHLFIVDAYDVVALSTMDEALRKIQDKNIVLFNSEINCWPFEQWAMLYPESETPYRYLNGGMAFVEVSRFIRMFEANPITHYDNDQVLLAKSYLTEREYFDMRLDTNCVVFQTLCGTSWDMFQFGNGRIKNILTDTYPCFAHGNGRAPLDKIYELI